MLLILGFWGWLGSIGCRKDGSGSSVVPTPSSAQDLTNSTSAYEPGVIMYQHDADLSARIASLDEYADYLKALDASCEQCTGKSIYQQGAAIVVAVRPGHQSRVWFVAEPGDDSDKWQAPADLKSKLESVPAPTIRVGPVAAAFVNTRAFPMSEDVKVNARPVPIEWRPKDLNSPGIRISDAIEAAWD